MRYETMVSGFERLEAIILSCKTEEQLAGAERAVSNHIKAVSKMPLAFHIVHNVWILQARIRIEGILKAIRYKLTQ